MAAAEYQKPCYYSDPYPPPPPPHSRRTCPCCLLSTFIKFLVGVVFALAVLAVILWIVFRPNPLKVHVESADLATFNLTSSGALRHNLTAEISIRNPNDRTGVYYDWLEADGYYQGKWFQLTPLPKFYQGHKNTTVVRAELAGETGVDLGSSGVDLFDRQREGGKFDVEVRMYGWVRYKAGSITTRSYRLRVKCWLPALTLLHGDKGFVRTRCKVNY